jgi:membrane dipeptidase
MSFPTRRIVLAGAAGFAGAALPTLAVMAGDPAARAKRLYSQAMVINGNLVAPMDDEADLDAVTQAQIRASGVTALKMSLGGARGDYAFAKNDIAFADRAIARSNGLYMKVTRLADLDVAKRTGKVGVIYSFEAAEMLDGRPERIDEFAALGVKIMQLGYNNASPFAAGCLTPQPSGGLTELGREAVARMNSVGVTLDVSHADDLSTRQAIAVARRPPTITHAACSAVYAHPRNKTDAALKALADKGGVVGLYELCFIGPGPNQQTPEEYLAHLLHALKVCGEDHVGIGSDALLTPFDTSPEAMARWDSDIAARKAAGVNAPGEGRPPFVEGLNRPDRGLVIAERLLHFGYSERAVEKVLGGNFRRVFAETWA